MSYDGAVRVPWNVNAVHDMRVALRRLRGALRDFVQVINEKPLRRVKTDLKRISDTLGVVRDLDVAIIALQELEKIAKSDEIKLGIGELIDEHTRLRERAHARLQKALESINLEALRQRFSLRIEESLRQQELFGPGNLIEAGRTIIESRTANFAPLGRRSTTRLLASGFTNCGLPRNACVIRSTFLRFAGARRSCSLRQSWRRCRRFLATYTIAMSGSEPSPSC